jgi:hypothetical protein
MLLCIISMFIYACECIGSALWLLYTCTLYLTMLYPINDLIWFVFSFYIFIENCVLDLSSFELNEHNKMTLKFE